MNRTWVLGLVASAFLLEALAMAQAPAAGPSIYGLLTDPTDRPVPGALVALTAQGRQTSTRTLATGEFRFDNLVAGRYRLSVTVAGFKPIERGVTLGNRPVSLLLKLALAPLKEEITVTGEVLRVSTEAGANLSTISVQGGMLESLPVLGLDYLTTLSRFLAAGMPGDSGPSIVVEGMEMRNVGVTPSAIQEIRINQNPYTAEYPRWSRRRIEVITKSATDRYHGTLNFLLRDHRLNAREAFAPTRPAEQRRTFEGSLFGPLGSGKNTSFLLSGMRESEDLETVVFAYGPSGVIAQNVPIPQQNTYGSLRISRQQGKRHTMFWQVNFQDRWQNNVGVGSVPRAASSLHWQSSLSSGATVLAEAGVQTRFREDEFIFNHAATLTPKLLSQFRILLGRYWAPTHSNTRAPRITVTDAFTGGGAQADALRTEVHTSITWLLTQTTGRHTLKYGFNVPDWSRRGFSDWSNQLGSFYFASLEDYRQNRPFSAIIQRGEPRTVLIERNLGGFWQDEWQLRPDFSLAAGLRYDWQNFFRDKNNFAPRLALAWAPSRSRNTVIRAGAGFFFDRSGPGPMWDVVRFDGVRLRRYLLSDPPASPDALAELVAALPTSVTRLERGIQLPQLFEFSVGVERLLAKKTTLAVNYIGTRGWHQLRSRDANAPRPPDYSQRPDSGLNVLRMIESAGRLEGNMLEVTVRGNLAPRVSGVAQYILSKTMANTGGWNWFPADSFDPRGEWARSDTDQRHQLNFLTTANLHPWLNLGLVISVLSGPPFTITTGGDENRDGMPLDRPPGVPRNSGRGPGYLAIDLRWSREFLIRPSEKEHSPKLTFSVDAFNVPNRVNFYNYVGALTSPFFGKPVASHPARRVQLAIRYQF